MTQGPGAPAAAHPGRPAAVAPPAPGIWNIANVLTMVRLLLVPVFVSLLFADGGHDPKWRSVAWAPSRLR